MTYLLLLLGLTGLFLGGDWLVRGASGLARVWGLSPMVIGAVIVGFGTSTPELLVSLNAGLGGQPEIALGNVIGSNIANLLLILGVAALIAPVLAPRAALKRDFLWVAAATLLLWPLLLGGLLGRIEGAILAAGLGLYIWQSLRQPSPEAMEEAQPKPLWWLLLLTALGLGAIILGAQFLVDSATVLARQFGVSEAMIGLTIVAVGTSLPELATTVVAALRGEREIALGNVLGSNIFNTLGILGLTAMITPLPVAARFPTLDMTTLALVTGGVIAFVWARQSLGRLAGAVLLAAYAGYIWIGAGL